MESYSESLDISDSKNITMVFEKKLNSNKSIIEFPHDLRAGIYFVKAVYEGGVKEWSIVVDEGERERPFNLLRLRSATAAQGLRKR